MWNCDTYTAFINIFYKMFYPVWAHENYCLIVWNQFIVLNFIAGFTAEHLFYVNLIPYVLTKKKNLNLSLIQTWKHISITLTSTIVLAVVKITWSLKVSAVSKFLLTFIINRFHVSIVSVILFVKIYEYTRGGFFSSLSSKIKLFI